jgi:hypothetical protein
MGYIYGKDALTSPKGKRRNIRCPQQERIAFPAVFAFFAGQLKLPT